MYYNKFITFGFSALLELAAGASYAFSLYSPALKESLHYNQVQIQNLGNALLPSLVVNLIPGFAYDSLQKHNRLGPRLALLIGALIHFVGYAGLWLVGTHQVEGVPYWAVVILGVTAMSGAGWTDVACISASVRSFAHDRGTAIGILKSMMGLSGSVYTTIYAVTARPDALSFLLFIALGLPVLTLLAAPTFNAVPFRQPGELPEPGRLWSNRGRFAAAYCVVGALSVAMLAATGLGPSEISLSLRLLVLTGMLVFVLPLFLLWLGSGGFWGRPVIPSLVADDTLQASLPLLDSQEASPRQLPGEDSRFTDVVSGKQWWQHELTATQSIRQLEFGLLYIIFGASTACGLLFLNNVGQMVESLDGAPDSQDPLVALFSVFSCLGRLAFGFLPEHFLHVRGTPRTWFLLLATALMAAATLLSAVEDLPLLSLAAPVTGLAYGAQWSLMPALASELFGLHHFGLIYCLLGSSVTVVSYLVSNIMGARIYQAALQEHQDAGGICIGPDCFRATFLWAAGLEAVAAAAALLLLLRTKHVFLQEHQEIKQEETVLRSPLTGHRLVPQRLSRANSGPL